MSEPFDDSTQSREVTFFRFPSPPSERIFLLVLMLIGIAWLPMAGLIGSDYAAHNELSLSELFLLSPQLQKLTFSIIALLFISEIIAFLFLFIKGSSIIRIGLEGIRFKRRGIPVFGWFSRDVFFSHNAIERIEIGKVRRVTVFRVEVRIIAGIDEIRVNLGHAMNENSKIMSVKNKKAWAKHPLVRDLLEQNKSKLRLL